MSDTIRTFIAFELPENIISTIRKVQKGIKSHGFNIRWVNTENIHLTLKFLGDVKISDIEPIGNAILETANSFKEIPLKTKGLGVFPNLTRPRVVWMGIHGDVESLIRLQKSLEDNLKKVGFPKEKRPYKGHLTIGRVKGGKAKEKIDTKKLVSAMNSFKEESDTFFADRIVLFKSDLKPTGAVYQQLSSAVLRDK